MNKNPRYKVPEQAANIRCNNFEEVSLGFDIQTAIEEADRCLNCKNPACITGCPVGVRIPEFIKCLKNGEIIKAYDIIKSTNSLPAVCGRVCPQESQCEKYCLRNKAGGAVAIGALERFVADYALQNDTRQAKIAPKIGKHVAIVGSGPAGLTCAGDLIKHGIDVTVYEAFHKTGGVLRYGIPEFRLPKALVEKEISQLEKCGVVFKTNMVVGKTILISELLEEYDAVFIGSGAGLPTFFNIKGENLIGVYSANEYLTRVNLMGGYKKDSDTPIVVGNKVVVLGAGNVAMDAARTALRMGSKEVTIVYRRTKNEMPARKEEIKHAEEEGIKLLCLTNPIEILGDTKVTGLRCQVMCLGEMDASGRHKPISTGDEVTIDADQVIVAIGTTPNPLIKNSSKQLETTQKGTIIIDEHGKTSIDRVYAGGDVVSGAATVILAMGAGKKAAEAIFKRLEVQ